MTTAWLSEPAPRLSQVAEHPAVREYYPALAHACSVMATVQIRNMGTVAGNLANAAPSADTAAPLLIYKASVVLVERDGRRQVELSKFFTGPGQTVAEPMEMIEAIRVPAPPARTGSSYMRISARSKVDICAAGVAGFLSLDLGGNILAARLALCAVAPTPVRCLEAEKMLEGPAARARPAQKGRRGLRAHGPAHRRRAGLGRLPPPHRAGSRGKGTHGLP